MSVPTTKLNRLPGQEVRVSRRAFVFRSGEAAHYIYRVDAGRVVLRRHTGDGNCVITSDVLTGGWLAEASVFEPVYHCDAVAVVDSVLSRVRHADVRTALQTDPTFSTEYMEYLSKHVRRLREQLEIRSILAADERIMEFLRTGARDGVFTVPGSYKNLADQVGLTHETLYRTLRKLEIRHLIRRSGREIILL